MGRSARWLVAVLVLGVACGRGQRKPGVVDGGEGGSAGESGIVDAGGSEGQAPLAGGGGSSGSSDVGAAGSEGIELGGFGGEVVGAAGHESGGAGAGGDAGAGGTPVLDECAVDGEVVLEATVATTTLAFAAPFEVTLGQGYSSQWIEEGEPLSEGCVTGQQTNSSAHQNIGGTEQMGGGSPTLGTLTPGVPAVSSYGSAELTAPFKTTLGQHSELSLYGYSSSAKQLWTYYLLNEARSTVDNCGSGFVRHVVPSRAMSVVFKVTFPTTEERDQFGRCYDDVLALDDTTPVSRYLIAHGATVAIHVFRAAGVVEGTQEILDETECSAANLPACATTLDALDEQRSQLLVAPADTVPLAEVLADWGAFGYGVTPYTILPD